MVRLDQELDSSPVRNASGYSENNLNSAMSTISQTHLGPDFSSGVVFVFTDLEGSTPMAEFDPKTFDYIMVVHDSIIRETLGKLSKDRLFLGGHTGFSRHVGWRRSAALHSPPAAPHLGI